MPELPEAETIARGLRPLVKARIAGLEVPFPDVLRAEPDVLRQELVGRSIRHVGRRGKNVVLALDRGGVLLVNLGMTGRLLVREAGAPDPATHAAVRLLLTDGRALVYDDVRRFGAVELLEAEAWAARSEALGPEPMDPSWTAADLRDALSRSRSPVRSWLLDQRKLAGVGNIYANEALHRAGIHPARPARSLGPGEARVLWEAIRTTLREAVDARGTTIRDYRDASGGRGGFAPELRVYGREGSPCPRCSSAVQRVVFGNRSAFFCPSCQPAP